MNVPKFRGGLPEISRIKMVRWLVSSTSQWIFVGGTQETPAFLDDGSNPEVSYKHKGGAGCLRLTRQPASLCSSSV